MDRGELVTKRMLGSTATYRVLDEGDDGHVLLEVIDAPGLGRGMHVTFKREAVVEMRRAAQAAAHTHDATARSLGPSRLRPL